MLVKLNILFLNIRKKPIHEPIRLSIGGKRIFQSEYIKYLGVLLDSNLSWKSQINAVASKLKRANGALAKLRHCVSRDVLIQVYYAIFYSHLKYCSQIWGQPSAAINRTSVLQNCAVRLMSFVGQRSHSSIL